MIYFLYGEDTYRSRRKLNEIIEEYRKKAGSDIHVYRFDIQDQDIAELKRACGTASLFSAKKLIIIERAFSLPDDFFTTLKAAQKHKDIIVVLWDEGADKKQIQKISAIADKTQAFKTLGTAEKSRWILAEGAKRGVRLSLADRAYFISVPDLWGVSNELDAYALSGGQVCAARLREPETIFRLGDTFMSAPKEALKIMFSLFEAQDEFSIFAYCTNHIRTLAVVSAFAQRGQNVPSLFGIHPFVVKKATAAVRFTSHPRLARTLKKFFEEDYYCKIGLSRPRESLFRILLGA